MKVVIAIDSFKGSVDSIAAGMAVAEGVRRVFPNAQCVVRPLADGGEGTVSALVSGLGGRLQSVEVSGPLGRATTAVYGLLPNGLAVMEMSQASGITLVADSERDPRLTSTFGVGEMVRDAWAHGARRFLMGIGGSATNDAGAGMLQALGFRLLDDEGRELPRGGEALLRLAKIIPPQASSIDLQTAEFRIACDVTNPLCGPTGASAVFGPQKGATSADVQVLDAALTRFAEVAEVQGVPVGFRNSAGTGAAGGLGYACRAFLNAELMPGAELVLAETHLDAELADADWVVTGEGRLDGQTIMGKAPIAVAKLAKSHGRRVIAFSGCVGDGVEKVNEAGIDAFFPVLRQVVTLNEALDVRVAAANLTATAEQVFRLIRCFSYCGTDANMV